MTVLSPGVPDGGHYILKQQVRGYRFENGAFRQVGGPVKFADAARGPGEDRRAQRDR